MFNFIKSAAFFVLKAFGFLLLGLFFVLFWQESLKLLKQRRLQKIYDGLYGRKPSNRLPLPSSKEKKRMRMLWNTFFELQKQRFFQRQEDLRDEFSAQIEHMRKNNH